MASEQRSVRDLVTDLQQAQRQCAAGLISRKARLEHAKLLDQTIQALGDLAGQIHTLSTPPPPTTRKRFGLNVSDNIPNR